MDSLARFLSDSTERAVLDTKTGTWTTSNWLLYLSVCQIISYPMIPSTAFVCKSSPIHSAAFAIGRSICRQVSKAARAMAGAGQDHFCPSKAMAEAMDAADMPGSHSKLLKLHRNLG